MKKLRCKLLVFHVTFQFIEFPAEVPKWPRITNACEPTTTTTKKEKWKYNQKAENDPEPKK